MDYKRLGSRVFLGNSGNAVMSYKEKIGTVHTGLEPIGVYYRPSGSATYNDIEQLYKVVIKISPASEKEGKVYVTNVGFHQQRYYTDSTLPDDIKIKLAFIGSAPESSKWDSHDDRRIEVGKTGSSTIRQQRLPSGAYTSTYPPAFDKTGWRFGRNYYTVIITETLLWEMKGQTSDSRTES